MLIADKINDILPQTQCRQCGFSGCRPYAEAIAQGEADINQCPPGGITGITKIASLLGRDPIPLNLAHGEHKAKMLAVIDESKCIGCTLCIEACPVDAILGTHQQMHTVINDECTGCELCIAPCPVDCISMIPLTQYGTPGTIDEYTQQKAYAARARYETRLHRLERDKTERAARHQQKKVALTKSRNLP